jgi:hypothetical protein
MTIAAGTFTLADYALYSTEPKVQAITMSLIDYGNVIQDVPMVTKQSLIQAGVRFEGNLPAINWVPLNAEGVSVHGQPTPYQEQVYIMREYVDVDKYIVLDQNQITDPRASQAALVLKALTYDINFKFFKNDHVPGSGGDANAPVGIRYRIDNPSNYGVRPENKIDCGGAAADLSQTGMTAKTGAAFFEMLDLLLWSVDSPDGVGVVLYMNDYVRRRVNSVIKFMGTSGGFDITKDQFDRSVALYRNAVIRDPGVKADQSTRILAGNAIAAGSGSVGETAAGLDSTGASANFASIYAVNYGTDHFFGWQFTDGPDVNDMGLINNGAIYRTLIDWAVGLMNQSTRSLGRLYDIKIG